MSGQQTAGFGRPLPARAPRATMPRTSGAAHILLLGALACSVATAGAAVPPATQAAGVNEYHTRFRADKGDGVREVEIEGKVRFSADASRVEWLGDSAYVRIITEEAGRRTRFEVAADAHGRPVARIAVDGRPRAFDADAQHRLAATLPVVFRELGHDVEARVRGAREQGGAPAVLAMIAGIRSAYSKRLHYDAYLDLDDLSDAEISGALAQLGEDLESDTDLANVLSAATDLYRDRPGIRGSYLACLAAFDSAAERSRFTSNNFGLESIGAGEQPVLSRAPGDC